MALAVKKRFNFLFEKNTLKFEKSLIATFFMPNIKLRVLDSLKIHVDGMDRNYLLNLITENNLNEISGFLNKDKSIVSSFFKENYSDYNIRYNLFPAKFVPTCTYNVSPT